MSGPQDIDWRSAVAATQAGFWTAYATARRHEDLTHAIHANVRASADYLLAFVARVSDGLADPRQQALLAAIGAYARIVGETVDRVEAAFGTELGMMEAPGGVAWPLVRERWFAVAEAEVTAVLRSERYLAVQGTLIGAAARWLVAQPPPVRAAVREMFRAPGRAQEAGLHPALTGVEIAATPRQAVWRAGAVTLWRYGVLRGPGGLAPVLICYGMIGRQSLTDLRPDRSVVRRLLAAGADVFALDWGEGGALDAEAIDAALGEATRAACRISGHPAVTLFGICHGGLLAAAHAATRPAAVGGLILAITPVDCHADRHESDPASGILNLWLRATPRWALTALIDALDPVPGPLMGALFNAIDPVRAVHRQAVRIPETLADPVRRPMALATEMWLADRPDLGATAARMLAVDLYHDNALAEGRLALAGRRLALGDIAVPVLNLVAGADRIVPPGSARALRQHIAPGRYTEQTLPTGHAGLFISTAAQPLLAPAILRWMSRTAPAPQAL